MTPAETRANHFARLNDYRQSREYQDYAREIGVEVPGENLPSLVGQRWEIDAELFDEFLEMLPPIYAPGGFFICEESFGGLHARFTREGDRYWCEFATLPRRSNAPAPGPQP